jgi:hypothetical protein
MIPVSKFFTRAFTVIGMACLWLNSSFPSGISRFFLGVLFGQQDASFLVEATRQATQVEAHDRDFPELD